MELEQLKSTLVSRINSHYNLVIESAYPYITCVNIITGSESGLEEMKTYILTMQAECEQLVAEVEKLVDAELLTSFEKGTDADMVTIVRSYYPDLTETQELALMDALYPLV